jgi:hypothetical protein
MKMGHILVNCYPSKIFETKYTVYELHILAFCSAYCSPFLFSTRTHCPSTKIRALKRGISPSFYYFSPSPLKERGT